MILRELNARETGTRQIHERGSAILVSTQSRIVQISIIHFLSLLARLTFREKRKYSPVIWTGYQNEYVTNI